MIGAIEFLRKAKAICNSQKRCNNKCPLYTPCGNMGEITSEADLVRKVMDYQINQSLESED